MDKLDTRKVTDRSTFVQLLGMLRQDWQESGQAWENSTLERFLEALQAYTNDLPGYYRHAKHEVDPNVASRKAFVDILLGAKMYE